MEDLRKATIRDGKKWTDQDKKYQRLAMQISLMMKSDTTNSKGNFDTVAPRIRKEKVNLIEELNQIDEEETDLIKDLEDLQHRLKMLNLKK